MSVWGLLGGTYLRVATVETAVNGFRGSRMYLLNRKVLRFIDFAFHIAGEDDHVPNMYFPNPQPDFCGAGVVYFLFK
jgi:hypothetical protein